MGTQADASFSRTGKTANLCGSDHPVPLSAPVVALVSPIETSDHGDLPEPFVHSPLYRTIVGFDIAGFGQRDQHTQNYVRTAMYALLHRAFVEASVPWPELPWREDRGDGALMIVSADATHQVIDQLVQTLYAGLRRHNMLSSEAAQITLRMAVHAGWVRRDEHGLTGEAIVRLYRLLDAPAFKEVVRSQRAVLGLVVSQYVYHNVVRHSLGFVDPDSFRKLHIVNKETTVDAWVHLHSPTKASPDLGLGAGEERNGHVPRRRIET
jgi:hypothetical protein